MDTFALPVGTDPARVEDRRGLLERLETGGVGDLAFRDHQRHAFELLASGRVAGAFRLDREPVEVRDRYGRTQFGQSLLLARRLVQAGVPIVQANMGIVQTWDTHVDNWGRLKNTTVALARSGARGAGGRSGGTGTLGSKRSWPFWASLAERRRSRPYRANRFLVAITGRAFIPGSLAARA